MSKDAKKNSADPKNIIPLLGHRVDFEFLGRRIAVFSDDPSVLSFFGNRFRSFRVSAALASEPAFNAPYDDFFLLVRSAAFFGYSFFATKDEIIEVPDKNVLVGLSSTRILNNILRSIPGFIFFHGAAISRDGEASLFLADSAVGKTTLVLELIKRGYSFLSDDVCAVKLGREGRVIYPFPKGLGIRKNTLNLLDITRPLDFLTSYYPDGREKKLLDIDDIFSGCISPPASVKNIFFLSSAHSLQTHPEDTSSGGDISLVFSRREDLFLKFLENQESVLSVSQAPYGDSFWKVQLSFDKRKNVVSRIGRFCAEHDLLVIDSWSGKKVPLAKKISKELFDRAPKLEKLTRSNGVLLLLHYFWGNLAGHYIYSEHNGQLMHLIALLRRFSSHVSLHKLHVGRLHETADLVSSVM